MCILNEQVKLFFEKGKDASLMMLRLVLAYGFYGPSMQIWGDIGSTISWFEIKLDIPYPLITAYSVAAIEMAGVILLTLGVGVRIISIPLIAIMLGAIVTVHYDNGFPCHDNGFEVPLYYIMMLLILTTHGAGKWGVESMLSSNDPESDNC